MDKVYLVGGLEGKAFPSFDLAKAYATARNSSIHEINFIENPNPVKETKGCVLHFNSKGETNIKPYTFNDLDDLPRIQILEGYGKYSHRLILPLTKKELTEEMINRIILFSTPYFKNNKNIFWLVSGTIIDFYLNVIKNIIENCDEAYMALIMLAL